MMFTIKYYNLHSVWFNWRFNSKLNQEGLILLMNSLLFKLKYKQHIAYIQATYH